MKRSPLPLRRTRVKARNAKRGGHRFPKLVLFDFRAFVRDLRCSVTHLRTGAWLNHPRLGWLRIHVDPAHVRPRGPGHPDEKNIIPLARHLHDELDHRLGRRLFAEKYGIDLEAVAVATWEAWLASQREAAW